MCAPAVGEGERRVLARVLVGRQVAHLHDGALTAPAGNATWPLAGIASGLLADTLDCVSTRFVGPSQPALELPEAATAVSAVTSIATLLGLVSVSASVWETPGASVPAALPVTVKGLPLSSTVFATVHE